MRSGRKTRRNVEQLPLRRSGDCEGERLKRHRASEIVISSHVSLLKARIDKRTGIKEFIDVFTNDLLPETDSRSTRKSRRDLRVSFLHLTRA